jgi:hypothetical protein
MDKERFEIAIDEIVQAIKNLDIIVYEFNATSVQLYMPDDTKFKMVRNYFMAKYSEYFKTAICAHKHEIQTIRTLEIQFTKKTYSNYFMVQVDAISDEQLRSKYDKILENIGELLMPSVAYSSK